VIQFLKEKWDIQVALNLLVLVVIIVDTAVTTIDKVQNEVEVVREDIIVAQIITKLESTTVKVSRIATATLPLAVILNIPSD
jgi:hypothetical protein